MKPQCLRCFRALSVKARFVMYQHLRKIKRQVSVNELVLLTRLRQPTVTFHVNALARAGLVKKTKVGRNVYSVAWMRCRQCPLIA